MLEFQHRSPPYWPPITSRHTIRVAVAIQRPIFSLLLRSYMLGGMSSAARPTDKAKVAESGAKRKYGCGAFHRYGLTSSLSMRSCCYATGSILSVLLS